ncbi:tetratricopeptide repeat protein [Paenibacillus sp. SAF-054]|uniref:tetratricopeptide repeat protein n=1 Tax=unclassified Paenibacillus TaxID=185978 RepID=UPI003F7D3C51
MIEIMTVVYIVLCGGGLWVYYRKEPREWLLRWVCVSIFPVIGWLFPLFWPDSWLKRGSKTSTELFAEQVKPEYEFMDIYTEAEARRDLGVLPIEEALVVNEHAERRKVMLDVLKQDAMTYIDVLQKAVSNEDSETSHYAVSMVMEVKRKLTLSMQELSVRYESGREDEELLKAYANVLRDYIRSGFIDERTLMKYRFIYLGVLKDLISVSPDTASAYEEKVKAELVLSQFPEAEQTALNYLKRFPDREEAYTLLIQVYYEMKSHKKLLETLDLLKKSPLRLSHHALTLVRFWSEGA